MPTRTWARHPMLRQAEGQLGTGFRFAMLLPIATSTSVHRTPWVNYGLIAANVLVFLVDSQLGSDRLGNRTGIGQSLDSWVLVGEGTRVYQFITYQFLHGGLWHLAGNMLFLWIFGNAVNAKLGNVPYLLFYLAGGVFAAIGHMHMNPEFYGMVGASGAIAAVTTAYLALFPRSEVTVLYWWFFIGTFRLPSMWLIVFKMILWDNVFAKQMVGDAQIGGVAFDAHLAGYAFGFATTLGLLAVRVLPRDQFDILALWKRAWQRRAMKSAMSDPNARARAQFGRVARPVSVGSVALRPERSAQEDKLTELRGSISEALSKGDRDAAAQQYEELLEIDPRQVLPRSAQEQVAYHFYVTQRFPQAAAAYEKLLARYSAAAEAGDVKLLLGIIYARDLQQYEVAEARLKEVLPTMTDEKRRSQCLYWLNVAAQALGRPATES